MAFNSDVLSFSYGEYEVKPQMNVSVQSVSATTLQNSYGILGQGINIGMLEVSVLDINSSNFDGIRDKITLESPNSEADEDFDIKHATQVATIIVEKDTGVARGFEHLYCASIGSYYDIFRNTEWLISQGANVINNSWGLPSISDTYVEYDEISLWMDHIALNHAVHMIVANGNKGVDHVSPNAMAYNVISVGNTNDKNTITCTDDVLFENSSYNNSFNNLAYKPDLCASGTNISIPGFDKAETGTSLSAPHVTGVIAMLCSYSPTLLNKPALVKSILMTGVSTKKRFHTGNQNGNIAAYKQYGAGIVNAYNAKRILDTGKYIYANFSATQTSRTYSLGTISAGETVSLSLCFLKNVSFVSSSGHENENTTITNSDLANLDIYIKRSSNQSVVASSTTTNNNVEKVIFTVPATDEYTITITKVENNTGTNRVYFGISWLIDSIDLP